MTNKTLPDGWQWKKLEEVCEKITDGSHFSPKSIEEGFPYITVRDVDEFGNIDFVNSKRVSEDAYKALLKNDCKPFKGDVLFSKDGTVGKVALIDFEKDFVILSSLGMFRPKQAKLDSRFLFLYLKSPLIQNYATEQMAGAAIKRIVIKTLKSFPLPLPPLEEQKRIVAKIDAAFEQLDEAISLQKNNISRTETFKKALLVEQFSKLPYEKKKLGEVMDVRDGTHDSPKYVLETKYPFVTSKNLKENGLDLSNTNFISEEDFINFNKRSKVDKGDLLFAMIGTVGNPVIINVEANFAIKNVALFKKNESLIKITFLRYFLFSPFGTDKMLEEANGATQKFVSLKYLRNFEIPLPPISEQEKIVAYLDISFAEIDAMLEAQKTRLVHLEGMKKAILQEAFEGKL